MYGELVKELRDSAEWADRLALLMGRAEGDTHAPIMRKAADAIEELSKLVDESIPKADAEIIIAEVAKPRWIPVTERLPDYGTTVLVYGSQGGIYTARYERARAEWGRDSWWKLNSKSHICNPTHWMPLPTPPTEE